MLLPQLTPESFAAFWAEWYPDTPPISYRFRHCMPSRWARIHSLPDAKRYATTPSETEQLLDRQYTVIESLVGSTAEIRVVVNYISIRDPLFDAHQLVNLGVFVDPDAETVFQSFLYATTCTRGALNHLLRTVADDEMRAFIIAPTLLIAPYDGGMDVILPDTAARDAFRTRFAHWLSQRRDGL